MQFTETGIQGVWIIEPKVFIDDRGYFLEAYKKSLFDEYIGEVRFIQDNESQSAFGVLRGLHYQEGDAAQAKLVRVMEGKVLDVVVDIRKGSPTWGKYVTIELSAENKKQLFIPRGLAHGFLVLSEKAIFSYKVDNVYSPSAERTLYCLDPTLGIHWPIDRTKLVFSEKDKEGKLLNEIQI